MPNSGMNVTTAQRDDWSTPPSLFAYLNARFGFTVDACASRDNAKMDRFWSESEDGLAQDWTGERVFFNPPFSQKGIWARKAAISEAIVAVAVLPAWVEQAWFHEWVLTKAHSIMPIKGRVRFIPPSGVKETSPRFGTLIAVWKIGHRGPCVVESLEQRLWL